ncbi:MAG: hypothetical protein HY721_12425 [Planctomycetes bacterium]|nr:hypothetical protein [Planctomycetota bacterium]
MRFFFDNCLTPRIVHALKALDGESEISHLRDLFPENASEEAWIKGLVSSGGDWVIVTIDQVWRVPQQRKVLRDSGFVTVWLSKGWGNQRLMLQAARLIAVWDGVKDAVRDARRGDWFELPFSGRIRKA